MIPILVALRATNRRVGLKIYKVHRETFGVLERWPTKGLETEAADPKQSESLEGNKAQMALGEVSQRMTSLFWSNRIATISLYLIYRSVYSEVPQE